MQAADIDGDGDSDIIVGDANGANNILWFENPLINPPAGHTADPKLEANWTYHIIGTQGETVHDLEIGDFNNDGKKDIVTSGHGVTHLWIQNSPTSWSDKNLSALAGSGVFIGDINRDGRVDIATPQGWLKNPGNPLTGTWVKYPINGTSGDEVLLGDLNSDGRLDVLTMNAHTRQEFAWFEAPADPTSAAWTKHVIVPAMGAHHPEIADFNNDGKPDILMGLELVDLSIYLNNGETTPTFTKDKLDTSGGHNARAGDLNGDGKIDIFASDYIGNPPVRVLSEPGPVWRDRNADSHCDPHHRANSDCHAYCSGDCYAHLHANRDPHHPTNTYAHLHANRDPHRPTNSYAHLHANRDPHHPTDSYAHLHANRDPHRPTDSYAHLYANHDPYRRANGHAYFWRSANWWLIGIGTGF